MPLQEIQVIIDILITRDTLTQEATPPDRRVRGGADAVTIPNTFLQDVVRLAAVVGEVVSLLALPFPLAAFPVQTDLSAT